MSTVVRRAASVAIVIVLAVAALVAVSAQSESVVAGPLPCCFHE
jgi:hypothetical protein